MRKIIIFVILVLSIWVCYTTVVNGYSIASFNVQGFNEITAESDNIDTLISQLTNLNEVQFPAKQSTLATAIKTYNTKKAEYDELVALMEQTSDDDAETEISLVDIYDVDYLWTIIGNYGTEEGITLKFDVVESTSATVASTSSYTMCDLKFTISGDYIALTDFIYDLEDDSTLGFEISNFSLSKGGENLQATFVVQAIPVNNNNLTTLTTSTTTETTTDSADAASTTDTTTDTSTDTNTTDTSTTDTNTTTDTTNTNTTSTDTNTTDTNTTN